MCPHERIRAGAGEVDQQQIQLITTHQLIKYLEQHMNTIKRQIIFYMIHIFLLLLFSYFHKYHLNSYIKYLNYLIYILTFYFASTVKKTSLKQFIIIELLMVIIIFANVFF